MKSIIVAILIAGLFIWGALLLSNWSPDNAEKSQGNNVSVVDGKQIITIVAKGRYFPSKTTVQANMPTVLRVQTNGTFDCSSALTIPAIGYRANLPPSGVTDIELPAQKEGTLIRGICGMGMFDFAIQFK